MYEDLKQKFEKQYGSQPDFIASAPGRTELSGNHTDHQHGLVIAGAVNRETLAAVKANHTMEVHLLSEGYEPFTVDLNDLSIHEEQFGTPMSLIRGAAKRMSELGTSIQGFDAYVISEVLSGSGLSSSAAFEVLIGVIFNHLTGAKLEACEIAKIGQYAENVYFGKPCGLMDQMASAVGNMIAIDFKDSDQVMITPLDFDFDQSGYALCIIDSGASHEDLTDEYAAITRELKDVCKVFDKNVLREIPEDEFYERIKEVREVAGDRGVLRAVHIYNENERVIKQIKALQENDFDTFLKYVKESGQSSWCLLQNVIPTGNTSHQDVAFALSLAEKTLNGKGACRVHGGGFAGTIQAFVPKEDVDSFKKEMERVLGEGKCHVMKIRHEGGVIKE
ncbi:MAG: galactokinase [Solobacterium sp.]|nr:galactokinase [Solobacterium sp.]